MVVVQEKYGPKREDWLMAPRPPCRSFCIQVATVCANAPEFIQTCDEIKCPQIDGTCTPGEFIYLYAQ